MGRSKRRGDGIRPRACGVQIYRIPISTRASTTKVASRARENRRNPALSLPLPLVRGLNFHLYGDYGLNVFNSRSLAYLKDKELESACVSFELRFAQIRDLKKVLRAEAIVYGRLPLMITENCLVQNETGCRLDRQGPCVPEDGPCRCGQPNVLVDRTGAAFPLLPAYGHRTEIQNSKPLYLADRPEHRRLGLAYARLRFTTETAEECVSVVQNYLDAAPAAGDFTRGLYERGVE